ncbi:MAG: rRNA (uracil1939-C5)-methyltransferase [Clostridiales bacterium]|jgi:23S rRNA (uracil1939-C5)-methyltransferase|nr:rRNA (uracil1939-C5)-methyltransferase [Clostridiales bacterium]MDN5282244.1 rRNA (uracil1939-C5)-methyltransferase [Candidatus Ozemobacter sp.]
METVSIEKMTYGIDSLSHIDGKVVFVPYAAPGDKAEIEIVEEKTDYLRAELKKILEESPDRRESPCPNFPECGGCHWLHLYPEAQRREKEDILNFILKPLNPAQVYPMEPLPITHYRNKMELKIAFDGDKVILGNYKYRSHDVVQLKGCIVQCKDNLAMLEKLEEFANISENRPLLEKTETIMVRTLPPQQHCVFYLKEAPTEDELKTLHAFFDENESLSRLETQSNLGNHQTLLREKPLFNFMKKNWRISTGSFFQNNIEGAEAILHTLLSIYHSLPHKGKFIDLYCGCGTQTFLLENLFDEVFGVECNQASFQDAIAFQKTRSNSKIKFICRKAETIFNSPITKGVIAALHLNPPRTGLSQRVLKGLTGIKPKVITYLSCNPTTFRRDAKYIRSLGYKLDRIYSFDLFPGTFHMETLSLFIRG